MRTVFRILASVEARIARPEGGGAAMKFCVALALLTFHCSLFTVFAQPPFLTKNLTAEQVAEYKKAVEAEGEVEPLVEEYVELRERLSELEGRIDEVWSTVFDSKSYLYNLAMDKTGNEKMLRLYEEKLAAVRQQQAEQQGRESFDAALVYVLQRRLLTEYEIALAEELGKTFATPAQLDTLRARLSRLP